MKLIIKQEVGTVYMYQNGILMYSPLRKDGVIDTDDFNEVDIELVKDEKIDERTLGDLYNEVELAIKE